MSEYIMNTNLISQIAQKIYYKNSKVPEELQASTENFTARDSVTLSKNAITFEEHSSSQTEYDKDRAIRFERIKSLVAADKYNMDSKVIEKIAEKIVGSLFG